jgi:glutamate transport system permease protein
MSALFDAPGPRARRRALISSVVAGAIVIVGLAWLIMVLASPRVNAAGVAQPGMLDPSRWEILLDRALWRMVWRGLSATLAMAAVAALFALVGGVALSLARMSSWRAIRMPAVVVIEFLRGMPVLLMMLFIMLVFATGAFWAGVGALAVYNGAVIAEALRSGVAALPRGQREAGLALGMRSLTVRAVIEYPQAFRSMLPIIIAQLVVLLKDTSLAYIIGYQELLNIVLRQGPTTFGAPFLFTLFFVVWAVYLAVNLTLSAVARLVAARTSAPSVSRRQAARAARVLAQLGGSGFGTGADPTKAR